MEIILIRPPTIESEKGILQYTSPPLGVAYLAAGLREAGYTTHVIDGLGEGLGQYHPIESIPDVVLHGLSYETIIEKIPETVGLIGISCMFSQEWLPTRDLINLLRAHFPETPIVVGGEHITAIPDYVMNDCPAIDYCVIGEGDETIIELAEIIAQDNLAELENVPGIVYCLDGELKHTVARKRIRQLEKLPRPAWDLIPIHAYHKSEIATGLNLGRTMPMLASRGCPYQCAFCSNPNMWGNLWQVRPAQEVVEEIKYYVDTYGVTNIELYDLTAIIRKEWIIELANLIVENGLDIIWQLPSGTRSEAIDAEVTQALYASGCRFIIYAPENGSDEILKKIKKRIKKDNMLKSMREAVKSGLNVKANIILGFPGEAMHHVLETYQFIAQIALVGISDLSVFTFSPYPGSELFDMLHKQGKFELNDRYFIDLTRYSNIGIATSYSEHFTNKQLRNLTFIGMGIFYTVSFGLRPWRFIRLLANKISGKSDTKLGASLNRLFRSEKKTEAAKTA